MKAVLFSIPIGIRLYAGILSKLSFASVGVDREVPKKIAPNLNGILRGKVNLARSISTMSEVNRGALIVFEGCDHSGKTTQCNKLLAALKEAGKEVQLLKFPDRDTSIGKTINSYLTNGDKGNLEDHSVHLLFSANRWEKVPKMLKMLNEGTNLIVDRYAFSGVAYTAAKGYSIKWCMNPDVGIPKPDVVCFLTLDSEAAAKRATYGEERYEKPDFQKKVMANFEKLKGPFWKEIDANKSIEDLHKEILQIANKVINDAKDKPLEKLWEDRKD